MDVDYNELNNLLDLLLKAECLPDRVKYSSNSINYNKYSKIRIIIKALYRFVEVDLFYRTYIKKKIKPFKKDGFFKSLKLYFYIFKIGLADLIVNNCGRFDNKLLAHYIIAAMLYDTSCDNTQYREYLKKFDEFIVSKKNIEPKDNYLSLFKESVDYIKSAVNKKTFDTFMNYIKIEHISQLMSIYQHYDKSITKDNLFKVTLAKGGITILAGIYLMFPDLSKEEKIALYEFGGVCQIFEDIYDIKEDLQIGIQTLPNQKLINYRKLKELYFGTLNNLIEKYNLDPNHPYVTLDILCWLSELLLGRRYRRYMEKKIPQIQSSEEYGIAKIKPMQ